MNQGIDTGWRENEESCVASRAKAGEKISAPNRIRTCDLSLRRGSRYPAVPPRRLHHYSRSAATCQEDNQRKCVLSTERLLQIAVFFVSMVIM